MQVLYPRCAGLDIHSASLARKLNAAGHEVRVAKSRGSDSQASSRFPLSVGHPPPRRRMFPVPMIPIFIAVCPMSHRDVCD